MNSGHTLYYRASASCSKILNVKTIFNIVKHFRASSSCSKFWMIKNIYSIQWVQGTLFFRASSSCSRILNVKTILNTVKIFRANSVSGQVQVATKSWRVKNIWRQWKISGKTLFIRASASCSKFWMIKKYIFNTVNSGQVQVAQKSWMWKLYSIQWKFSGQTLFSGQA